MQQATCNRPVSQLQEKLQGNGRRHVRDACALSSGNTMLMSAAKLVQVLQDLLKSFIVVAIAFCCNLQLATFN